MSTFFRSVALFIRDWWRSSWSLWKVTQVLAVLLCVTAVILAGWFGLQTWRLRQQAATIAQQYQNDVQQVQETIQKYAVVREKYTDVKSESGVSPRQLFRSLKELYVSPQTIEIDEPSIPLHGTVFIQYDQNVKKTFLFSRIENLVKFPSKVPVFWLTQDKPDQLAAALPLGVPEVVVESNIPTAYFVYVADGDIHGQFSKVVISYEAADATTIRLQPSYILLERSW